METYQPADESEIRACLIAVLPAWSHLHPQLITLKRMTGITNQIYKATAPHLQPVIYRHFGNTQSNPFLDRKAEEYVYAHISQIGLGPKIFHTAKGLRIEEFIENQPFLSSYMLEEDYVEKVAFSLRKFHEMTPQIEGSLFENAFFGEKGDVLQRCLKKMDEEIFNETEQGKIKKLREWVCQGQLDCLRKEVAGHLRPELVFSHNDLLANNVLLRMPGEHVLFIDYEYAMYNYRIFDIANYFNEAQFDYDNPLPPYFSLLPSKPNHNLIHRLFIQAYVNAQFYSTYEEMKQGGGKKEGEMEVELLLRELRLGRMLSDLMWGWWAILVSKNPSIQFDYISFAEQRMESYMRAKHSD